MVIRAARPDDLAVLPEIERRAGAGFRALGMAAEADDPQPAAAELDRYRRAGQAWVAIVGDQVVGYLLVENSRTAVTSSRSRSTRPTRGRGSGPD